VSESENVGEYDIYDWWGAFQGALTWLYISDKTARNISRPGGMVVLAMSASSPRCLTNLLNRWVFFGFFGQGCFGSYLFVWECWVCGAAWPSSN